MSDYELPPLPEHWEHGLTEFVRSWGRAAIEADRQARCEPSYWKITKKDGVIFFECYHAALENYKKEGWSVEPLYAVPQPQQIPEGYKLVPIEPTEEMLRAAYHAVESEAVTTTVWLRKTVYKAMLEAAPEVKP